MRKPEEPTAGTKKVIGLDEGERERTVGDREKREAREFIEAESLQSHMEVML